MSTANTQEKRGNRAQEWYIFTENREAVIKALEAGECDGILLAA